MSHREKRRELGRRLQFEREAIEMTREEMAAQLKESTRLPIGTELVKRWELGRTRIPAELLTSITDTLGIRVERLLAGGPGRTQQAQAA